MRILPIALILCLLTLLRGPLCAAAPAPEHVRASLSLDGTWQCAVDARGDAPRAEWARQLPDPQPITLPGSWAQSPLTCDVSGAVWYTREVTLPEKTTEAGVLLVVEHPVGRLEVYRNETPVAQWHGNGLPRRVRLRGVAGETLRLTFRLAPGDLLAARCGLGAMRLEVLSTVRLEALAPVVRPTDGLVTVRYRVSADEAGPASLSLELVTSAGRTVAKSTVPLEVIDGTVEGEALLHVAKFAYWSPANRQHYRLTGTVMLPGKPTDTLQCNVGASQAALTKRGWTLNGAPLLLKGLRLSGTLPYGVDDTLWETLGHELRLAQQAGFNAVWLDGAAVSETLLAQADALGMLVIVEMPRGEDGHPDIFPAVEELGHHPSLLAWAWPISDTPQRDLATLRTLDPLRPALVREGETTNGYTPGTVTGLPLAEIDAMLALPLSPTWLAQLQETSRGGAALLVTGIGVDPVETDAGKEAAGAVYAKSALYLPEEHALLGIRRVVELVRTATTPMGYFVRPLPQAGTLTGLRDAQGAFTRAFYAAGEYNCAYLLAAPATHTLAAGGANRLEVTLINEARFIGDCQLTRLVTDAAGETQVYQRTVTLSGEPRQDLTRACPFAGSAGVYQVHLILSNAGRILASTRFEVAVAE